MLWQGPVGDDKISEHVTIPFKPGDLDETMAWAQRLDPAAAGEITSAVNSGRIRIVRECDTSFIGSHDYTTIALSLKIGLLGQHPPWVCGAALLHEWEHIKGCPAGSQPGDKDPRTDPKKNPCGDCLHSEMEARSLDNLARISCMEGGPSQEAFCKEWCKALKAGEERWKKCTATSPACAGVDPSAPFSSRLTRTPCVTCNC